jgi:hypothetical protein
MAGRAGAMQCRSCHGPRRLASSCFAPVAGVRRPQSASAPRPITSPRQHHCNRDLGVAAHSPRRHFDLWLVIIKGQMPPPGSPSRLLVSCFYSGSRLRHYHLSNFDQTNTKTPCSDHTPSIDISNLKDYAAALQTTRSHSSPSARQLPRASSVSRWTRTAQLARPFQRSKGCPCPAEAPHQASTRLEPRPTAIPWLL